MCVYVCVCPLCLVDVNYAGHLNLYLMKASYLETRHLAERGGYSGYVCMCGSVCVCVCVRAHKWSCVPFHVYECMYVSVYRK